MSSADLPDASGNGRKTEEYGGQFHASTRGLLTVDYIYGGYSRGLDWHQPHAKTVPCTIAAQVLRGAYEVSTPTASGRAGPGEAFLAAPYTPLTIAELPDDEGVFLARWVHFRCTIYDLVDVSSLLQLPLIVDASVGERLGAVIQDALAWPSAVTLGIADLVRRHEAAFRLLRILVETAPVKRGSGDLVRRSARLAPALAYIHDHLCDSITVEDLAEATGVSASRLFALFADHLGMTPMRYVKQVRLATAAHELTHAPEPIAEISRRMGFATPFHFSREFKTAFGMSPSRFRQDHRVKTAMAADEPARADRGEGKDAAD